MSHSHELTSMNHRNEILNEIEMDFALENCFLKKKSKIITIIFNNLNLRVPNHLVL